MGDNLRRYMQQRIDPSWTQAPAPQLAPPPAVDMSNMSNAHPSQLTQPGPISALERYNQIKNAPPAPPPAPEQMSEPERIARALVNPLIGASNAVTGLRGLGNPNIAPAPAPQQAEVPAGPQGDPREGATFADPPPGMMAPAPQPQRIVAIPGGRQTQGWHVQEGAKISDGTYATIDAAQQAKERVLTQEAAAGQQAADREAAFADGYQKTLAFYNEQEGIARDQRLAKQREVMDQLEASNREAAADANNVAGKAIGSVLSTIGIALGAWGGTLDRSGRNAGLEAYNAATNAAIADQRAKAEKENNYFAKMKAMFGDEERAEMATKMAFNEAAKAKAAQLAATTKSEMARANADRVQAQLMDESAKLKERFDLLTQDKVQRTDANVPTRYIGTGGIGAKQADVEKYGEAVIKSGLPETRQKLAEVQARIDAFAKDGQSIEGVAGNSALGGWLESAKPDAALTPQGLANRQMVSQLVAEYSHTMSGAGMSDAERERYEKNVRGAKTTAELQRSLQQMQNALEARQRAHDATYDPRAVAEWQRRVGPARGIGFSQQGVVPTVKPAGSK